MRYVKRPASPPKLLASSEFVQMRREYLAFLELDPRERAQTRPPDRHLPSRLAGKNGPLAEELGKVFGHRCAFCESRGDLSPYRFRPTSYAEPTKGEDDHLAYGWLADAWQNLYPICDDCWPKQPNLFPVNGDRSPLPTTSRYRDYVARNDGRWTSPLKEHALLIDPCKEKDLSIHFHSTFDGVLYPRTENGEFTIRQFNLNRSMLVGERLRQIEMYRHIVDNIMSAALPARPSYSLVEKHFFNFYGEKIEAFIGFFLIVVSTLVEEENTRSSMASAEMVPISLALDETLAPPVYALKSVSLKNYKAHENLHFDMPQRQKADDPTPCLLILGENAAGKSSILEAMALSLVDDKARKALKEEPGSILLDPAQMGIEQPQKHSGLVELEFATAEGQEAKSILEIRPDGFKSEGPTEGIPPVFAYGAYRHFKKAYHEGGAERSVISLFQSDHLLSNPEQWLIGLDDQAFNAVIAALRHIFGPSGGFSYIERRPKPGRPSETYCVVVSSTGTETSPSPSSSATATPLNAVSSGFRTVLALACDTIRWLMKDRKSGWGPSDLNNARALILIDEVEAHLHPRWKVQIMDGLRKALPAATFIVTSHDPLCLRGMRDGEVMVLRRMPGEQADTDLPVKVERLAELPNVSQLTIEQLLKSEFFALFDTDDPRSGASIAELAAALAGAPGAEADRLRKTFMSEINAALPPMLGRSEVSRLVHDAVAHYIRQRPELPDTKRQEIREETRKRIVSILQGAFDA
ncbi:AAA family ATPase [Rhabdaerophilum sp. SD176]|uniref:AAA family ATPase n=1 Tax=Rhabdaerophilum sp. SD176 TaxID=2983548 RepID=UPI0024E03A71|nr:AAA family ATPase [Rhabdaerophilum sp. SD176]